MLRTARLELDVAAPLDVAARARGSARLKAIVVSHACAAGLGWLGVGGSGFRAGLLVALFVESAPAEKVLLLLLVLLALGGFDLLGVLNDGGLLVKLNLGLLVGRLGEVLLLGLLGCRCVFFLVVVPLGARGRGLSRSRGFGFLVLLLFASLLCKQVLDLLLVAHCLC